MPTSAKVEKVLAMIAPPRLVTWTVAVTLFLVLITPSLFCSLARTASEFAENLVNCAKASASLSSRTCELQPGEKVQITICSHLPNNETKLKMTEGETYTARLIELDDWQDAGHNVSPGGFQFEKNCFGWPCFWWAEWMRPFREGTWFQVVGRIDRNREAFAVLGAEEASKPHAFKSPASGELVLMVNDVLYFNNRGAMTIEIRRCATENCEGG